MTHNEKHKPFLPCPMCGGKADYNWNEISTLKSKDTRQWYVHCAPDDSFKGCIAHDGRFPTLREAVAHWNTRFTPQTPSLADSELVEKLIKAAEELVALKEMKDSSFNGASPVGYSERKSNAWPALRAALSAIRTHTATPVGQVKGEEVGSDLGNNVVIINHALRVAMVKCDSTVTDEQTYLPAFKALDAIASLPRQVLPSESEAVDIMYAAMREHGNKISIDRSMIITLEGQDIAKYCYRALLAAMKG